MSDSKEIEIMRRIAWARVKGELDAFKATHYYSDITTFEEVRVKIDEFVKDFERCGYEE